jgi:hypothetical protein
MNINLWRSPSAFLLHNIISRLFLADLLELISLRITWAHQCQRPDSDAPGDAKIPPMVSEVQPSAKVCCSKSARKASKHGRSTSARKRQSAGAMRKTAASKERHEGCLERLDTLKEVGKSPFPADGIADQQCEKIDGFIAPEAPSDQANPARAKASNNPLVAR